MNRRVFLWLIAIGIFATVGCIPRHPPHTPQPLGILGTTDRIGYDQTEGEGGGGKPPRTGVAVALADSFAGVEARP